MAWRERENYGEGEDWWNQPDVTQPPPPTAPTTAQTGAVRQTPSDSGPPGPVAPFDGPWMTQYNNGSPPDIPLGGGMQGWNWNGSRWGQTSTPGITGVIPPPPPPRTQDPTPPGPRGGGAVPSVQANIPPATLPSGVQSKFDYKPPPTPIQSAFQSALLKYLGSRQEAPSLDDATLRPQSELFRVQQQRDQEKNRRFAAERAAATGRSQSGYFDNLVNEGVQQQRLNTQQFNTGLLGQEMTKRREELMTLLRMAQATGDAEAARELQTRLAEVSASIQQQGLNLQGQLGFGDLALRALLAEMGSEQFYDALGVNTAMGLEGLNQRALQIAMGG